MKLTYRFESRSTGSDLYEWTEATVEIPAAYPLAIHIRPHGQKDRAHLESRTMVDVEVGDSEFDRTFLIEAAPADVVKLLLDASTRKFLLTYLAPQLDTITVDERKLLRLTIPCWLDSMASAQVILDQRARIGERIRDAFAAVEGAAVEHGSPYRPMLDDQPARDAAARRVQEVATVEALRYARITRGHIVAIAVIVAVIGAFALLIVVASSR